jgi:hypothetical protein
VVLFVDNAPRSYWPECNRIAVDYEFRGNQWWAIGAACMPDEVCQPRGEEATQPCVFQIAGGGQGVTVNCDNSEWNDVMRVSTECPTNVVFRNAYPRVLVNREVQFVLEPERWSPSAAGKASNEVQTRDLARFVQADDTPTRAGLVRKMKLMLRSERLEQGREWEGDIAAGPKFDFGGAGQVVRQEGYVVTYRWTVSSAGGEKRGRRYAVETDALTDRYDMPAHRVNVQTHCGHWWQMTWEESEGYDETTFGNCETATSPIPAEYTTEGCGAGDMRPVTKTTKYRWVNKASAADWTEINMKTDVEPALTTAYAIQTRVQGTGYFKGTAQADPVGEMWVPVVEVQSVLRSESCFNDPAICPESRP